MPNSVTSELPNSRRTPSCHLPCAICNLGPLGGCPCHSTEGPAKLVSRFIAGVSKPARPAAMQNDPTPAARCRTSGGIAHTPPTSLGDLFAPRHTLPSPNHKPSLQFPRTATPTAANREVESGRRYHPSPLFFHCRHAPELLITRQVRSDNAGISLWPLSEEVRSGRSLWIKHQH